MKSEQLKREFADEYGKVWDENKGWIPGDYYNKMITDLNVLIEAVIAERMPTENEAQNEALKRFISNTDYVEIQKVHAFVKGVMFCRSRMKGNDK